MLGSVQEQSYFDEGFVRVTNFRITCKSDILPINNIAKAYINLHCNTLFLFIFGVILFPVLIVIGWITPYIGVLLIIASFIGLQWTYTHYVELLIVLKDGAKKRLIKTSGVDRKYAFRVLDAINHALAAHAEEETTAPPGFSVTKTMRMKSMLEEYERN